MWSVIPIKINSQSITELQDEIIDLIGETEPELCKNVIENFN